MAVMAILAVGAVLRFWTLGHGAPYVIGVDEPVIVDTAVRMIRTGDFNPHFFDYPGLTYYLQAAVAAARFLAGAMSGQWLTLEQVWTGEFYVWARAATAALGTLTIVLVYRAGLRWGAPAALFAAVVFAIQPNHVRESHFALTDVPMTFFVALTLVQSLSAAQSRRPLEFFLAALAAGLAAATKYNGGLAILMPLCAAAAIPGIRAFGTVAIAIVSGGAIGFLVGAPYTLLDLPAFLNGFARLMNFYNVNPSVADGAATYGIFVAQGFGWPGVLWLWLAVPAIIVCALGAGRLAVEVRDASRRPLALIVLVFPLVYFWFISGQSLRFARYALPLTPFLAIWFGAGASVVLLRARALTRTASPRAWRVATVMIALMLLPPLAAATTFNIRRMTPSPSEDAARWLMAALQPGEGVAIEGRAMIQLPSTKGPVIALNRLIEQAVDEYRRRNVVYLVASSSEYDSFLKHPNRDPVRAAAYSALFRNVATVQVFRSPDENRWPTIRILRLGE